ncbi:hypothetical protein V1291_000074 [Nitrobacteraceae bacterium AZCC 1564]
MIHHMKMPDSLHTVFMMGGILAVRCKQCRQGGVFTSQSMPSIVRGNMTTVASLPFVCSHCKSRDYETFIARTMEQAHAFVAGGDPASWGK